MYKEKSLIVLYKAIVRVCQTSLRTLYTGWNPYLRKDIYVDMYILYLKKYRGEQLNSFQD